MSENAGGKKPQRQNDDSAETSLCAATWTTALNGNDDGDVEVMDDGGNRLKGTHKKSGDPITGYCTPGRPHLIHLERTDSTGTLHTYDGSIFRVDLPLTSVLAPFYLVVGTHKPATKLADGGDDDWMGGHTT